MLARGRPVLMLAAHQSNWDWCMYAMAAVAGLSGRCGLQAAALGRRGSRAVRRIARRWGVNLVPAKDLLPDLLQRRRDVRAHRHAGRPVAAHQRTPAVADLSRARYRVLRWGRSRSRAPRAMARSMCRMRRVRRGRYEAECRPLAEAGERWRRASSPRATRAWSNRTSAHHRRNGRGAIAGGSSNASASGSRDPSAARACPPGARPAAPRWGSRTAR